MKPEIITLSDALRDRFGAAIERAGRTNFDIEGAAEKILRDLTLPEAERAELNHFLDVMTGLITGYGCPFVHITNLPSGETGNLLANALLTTLPGQAQRAEYAYAHVKNTPEQMKRNWLHQAQHRDGAQPVIQGLYGFTKGEVASTTVVTSCSEFIDEVARHYRKARDRTPLDAPLDAQIRHEVIDLLCQPYYSLTGGRVETAPLSVLLPEPRRAPQKNRGQPVPSLEEAPRLLERPLPAAPGAEWPQPYRFHPMLFARFGLQNYVSVHPEGEGKLLPQVEALRDAIEAARFSLKDKEGPVVGPGELLIWNGSFVIHGCGRQVENPDAPPGEARNLMGHLANCKTPRRVSDHGFIAIASPVPPATAPSR